jgi:hypothetical protein
VQSKIAFARLLDELGAPHPRWWPVEDDTVPGQIPYPYFLNLRAVPPGRASVGYEHPQNTPARLPNCTLADRS